MFTPPCAFGAELARSSAQKCPTPHGRRAAEITREQGDCKSHACDRHSVLVAISEQMFVLASAGYEKGLQVEDGQVEDGVVGHLGGPEGPGDKPEPRAAADRPVADEKDKALARVAAWWPQGIERTDPEPPAVAFTGEAVASWGPPNPAEASQTLSASYRYCAWRLDRGLDLDLQSTNSLKTVSI